MIERNLVVREPARTASTATGPGRGSLVTRNLVHGNGGSGIHATGFAPCPELRDNYVSRNGLNGITVVEAFTPVTAGVHGRMRGMPVTGNTAQPATRRMGSTSADMGAPVVVGRNRANRNAELGIEATDVIDGGRQPRPAQRRSPPVRGRGLRGRRAPAGTGNSAAKRRYSSPPRPAFPGRFTEWLVPLAHQPRARSPRRGARSA